MAATDFGSKVRAHTRYYLASGEQVVGVTTVLSVLAKPALIGWANRKGLEGIDTSKFVDEAAAIGTLAHALIAESLGGSPVGHDDFTAAQLARARHGVRVFEQWRGGHELEVGLVETQLVSETHKYGGTVDLVAVIDGVPTLVDIKSSSGIWDEHVYQVAAYEHLLRENGQAVEAVRILRVGRSADDGLEERRLTPAQVLNGWHVFERCLQIWNLKKATR
jgi:hypothetical protein